MAGVSTLARTRARIEDASRSGLSSVPLRLAVLAELRSVVSFDAHVWVLTDPVTTVGVAPLADVPPSAFRELPALVRARYAVRAHRWTSLRDRSVAAEVVDVRAAAANRPESWPGLLAAHGVGSVGTLVSADAYGCWGFLDLWRTDPAARLDEGDADALAVLAPVITTALRSCQARTFDEPADPGHRDAAPVVLTLDDELAVRGRTSSSQAWLDRLLPPEPGASSVPASVLNVAAQLLAAEAGVDAHPAFARTHLDDGLWLTVRAARMAPTGDTVDGSAGPIVVTLEETSAADRLELFARASGLSPRENEVVALLAAGADTRAIARRLGVSELTVQDHLKSVFARTGAHDRLSLVSRALGTRGPFGG